MQYVVARSLSDGDESTQDPVEVVHELGPDKRFDLPVDEHGVLYLYGIGEDYECELDTVYVADNGEQ